ncbi:hypothetical protein [Haliea sp. E17]|uniref:hypothetical protein n=1 Tax=Haliea sp. E17 TaxID=3401576 RepID=UPI003AAF6BA3
MNKFNLTFSGVISRGRDPERARARFAEIFDIHDRERLEQFFSGETIILRRNLERKEGGEYYARMRKHGLEATLVKIIEEPPAASAGDAQPTRGGAAAEQSPGDSARPERQAQASTRKRARKATATARKQARIDAKRQQRQREVAARRQREEDDRAAQAVPATPAESPPSRVAETTPPPDDTPDATAAVAPSRSRIRSRLKLTGLSQALAFAPQPPQRRGPNPYRLQPFRSTARVRQRARDARHKARRGQLVAGGALALLLILLGSYIAQRPTPLALGPAAVAATANGKLYILVGQQLLQHDRAGVPESAYALEDWGIGDALPPLLADGDGTLLLRARAHGKPDSPLRLWRCQPVEKLCRALPGEYAATGFDAITRHHLTGDLVLASLDNSRILRISSNGEFIASAEVQLPTPSVLQLDTGLLLINRPEAPAIGVFRIEPEAFGKQIDELLLLPPPALEAEQTTVVDFLRQGDNWWVTMRNPGTGSSGLYLFDSQWNFLRQVPRPAAFAGARLIPWKDKVLLSSPQQASIQRYNAAGDPEAGFSSPLLEERLARDEQLRHWQTLAWRLALTLCVVALVAGVAYLQFERLRSRVFSSSKPRGAEPLDAVLDQVAWVPENPDRSPQLRRDTLGWLWVSAGLLLLALAFSIPVLHLLALLVFLGGPFLALQILKRSPLDRIGLLKGQCVLVDHLERYHSGGAARVKRCGPFLFIDDIVVFTGTALIPALASLPLLQSLAVAGQGIRHVPSGEVVIRLLESRHPLARAALTGLATTATALLVVLFGQLPW